MNLDPTVKMSSTNPNGAQIEKYIVRKAFDVEDDIYLPHHILYRQKEQFSDGVGYSWIDYLREYAENEVTDKQMLNAKYRFPYNTPMTKEAYYYRTVFEEFYGNGSSVKTVPGGPSIACSTAAAIEWDEAFKKMAEETNGECSGRSVSAHKHHYKDNEGARGVKRRKLSLDETASRVLTPH